MILGLGAVAVDDLLGVARFPSAGEKMRVLWRRREDGGLAATALAAAAKLGARAAWLGTLGDDELSRAARAGLERDGVLLSHAHFAAAARPHSSMILVEEGSGQRTVLSCNAGVPAFGGAITGELLHDVSTVFVDHTQVEVALQLTKIARERGIPVVSDIERAADGTEELLPHVDHFIAGLSFAQSLTGESETTKVLRALRTTFGTGAACCALTDGERGCWFLAGNEVRHIPAFRVEAVDTTGCGDAFHGAYGAEIARGASVESALRFASAAAALVATRIGGRSGLPTRADVEALLAR